MQGGIVLKKQSNLSRLLSYAGGHKYFTYASWVLSGISALTALVPFWYIWKIINEVLEVSPNFGSAANLTHYGIMAMTYAIISYLIYIGALLCSHLAAFRIAANMRIDITEHISKLPIGFADSFGSGKLRKIINDSTAATETYLAHQLPDKYAAMATPVGLLALLLVFDWRLGLLSLVPVAVGFAVMSAMTGKRMEEKMRQYSNALAAMSNEAVEYVRGIPVVKTFGQSVFSFKKFKATIDEYKKWVLAYTKDMRPPMMLYTAAINGVFAFLILGAFWFTNGTVTSEFFVNLLFYIIITPVISVTLTKIMYMSEEGMVIGDAIERIDSVLNAEPMSVGNNPQNPKSTSIELENIHFSYDGKKEAVSGISLKIKGGQTVAFVGPSGGGKSTLLRVICGLSKPYMGAVSLFGKKQKAYKNGSLFREMLAFLPQEPVTMFVKESVREDLLQSGDKVTVENVSQRMGIEHLLDRHPWDLSGGEIQKCAFAKILLADPKIIVLDECTKGMDSFAKKALGDILLGLKDEGRTILLVTHDLEFAAQYCDRCGLLFDGKIVAEDNAVEFFSHNRFYTTAVARLTRGFFSGAVTSTAVRERLAMVKRGQNEQ